MIYAKNNRSLLSGRGNRCAQKKLGLTMDPSYCTNAVVVFGTNVYTSYYSTLLDTDIDMHAHALSSLIYKCPQRIEPETMEQM